MKESRLPLILSVMCITTVLQAQPCSGGLAGSYPCNNVNLSSHLSPGDMGATRLNDIWGWRDPQGGSEYALVGINTGTAFLDVSNAADPNLIGTLPSATVNSNWRDIKVVNNHAFIVSEAADHGMQVFDLTRLRAGGFDLTFEADTTLTDLGSGLVLRNAHNIVADEENEFVYTVGTRSLCSGGLVAIDVSNPKAPVYAGCFAADGYTHDAQIINKSGQQYALACNENSVTIVNVTDKSNMTQVARVGISDSHYIHQGWATTDLNYFLVNDEFDEPNNGHNTRTHILDISDLGSASYMGYYEANTATRDHNLYTTSARVFQANYQSGLRIYDLTDLANNTLTLVGIFDTYPSGDGTGFAGAWSVYPYFGISKILVSSISEGLFVLDYNGQALPIDLSSFTVQLQDGTPHLQWTTANEFQNEGFDIERSIDGVQFEHVGFVAGAGSTQDAKYYQFSDVSAPGGTIYYRLRQVDFDGQASYSPVRQIKSQLAAFQTRIYPNLVRSGDPLFLEHAQTSTTVSIHTLSGQTMQTIIIEEGRQEIPIDKLPAGGYVIAVHSAAESSTHRIFILD